MQSFGSDVPTNNNSESQAGDQVQVTISWTNSGYTLSVGEILTIVRFNADGGVLYTRADGTKIWSNQEQFQQRTIYYSSPNPETPPTSEILLFKNDDIGREIEFLTGDLTGEKTEIRRLPQLDPSNIHYAGVGVFPIANTYIGADIHYLDVGVEWRWVTFNDDHPNTGVYTRSYFQIAGTPTGVRVVIELKVTWDLRFYHGTQQYGELWESRNVYPYPAQTSADATVLRTELGRIWGWDDWKPALNNEYYTYRIRTVIIPEEMRENSVYFSSPDGTDFDRLTLLDSNEGVFTKRRFERLYQGGHSVRPTALLILDKQIWTNDPDDGNKIKLVGGTGSTEIPFIFNCSWSYDGSQFL